VGLLLVDRGVSELGQTHPVIKDYGPEIVILGLPLDLVIGASVLLAGFAIVTGTVASYLGQEGIPEDGTTFPRRTISSLNPEN
jgi:hypothetical protein